MLQGGSSLPALHQDSSVLFGSSVLSGFPFGFPEDRGVTTATDLRDLCQLQVLNTSRLPKSIPATFICLISTFKHCYLWCFPNPSCVLLTHFSVSHSRFLNPATTAQETPLESTKPIWDVDFKQLKPVLRQKETKKTP